MVIKKFRGLKIDNSGFEYGHYFFDNYALQAYIINANGDKVDVFSDSIEQFIDFTDKNGKDVYEGDICQVYFNQNSDRYIGTNINNTIHNCVVKYNRYTAGFRLSNITEKYKEKHNFSSIDFGHNKLHRDLILIIGNIHENPELLNPTK